MRRLFFLCWWCKEAASADALKPSVPQPEQHRNQRADAGARQEADARLAEDGAGDHSGDDGGGEDRAAGAGGFFGWGVHARANAIGRRAAPAIVVNGPLRKPMRPFERRPR